MKDDLERFSVTCGEEKPILTNPPDSNLSILSPHFLNMRTSSNLKPAAATATVTIFVLCKRRNDRDRSALVVFKVTLIKS